MKKTIVCLLLVLCMLIGLTPAMAEEPVKLVFQCREQDMVKDNLWYIEEVEKAFNVDIEIQYRPAQDYNTWLTTKMAAGEVPEYMMDVGIGFSMLKEMVDQGAVAEVPVEMLYEYAPEYMAYVEEMSAKWGVDIIEASKIDGKLYCVPNPFMQYNAVGIRGDWLDNLGLEMPVTVEDWNEVMRAFTEDDPDGNGVDDTYGYTGVGYSWLNYWFSSVNGTLLNYWTIKDNEVVDLRSDLDALKEAFSIFRNWWQNGWVEPEWETESWDGMRNKAVANKIGVYADTDVNFTSNATEVRALQEQVPGAYWNIHSAGVKGNVDGIYWTYNPVRTGIIFSYELEGDTKTMGTYVKVATALSMSEEWLTKQYLGREGETFKWNEDGSFTVFDEYITSIDKGAAGFGEAFRFPSQQPIPYIDELINKVSINSDAQICKEVTESQINSVCKFSVLDFIDKPLYDQIKSAVSELNSEYFYDILTCRRPLEDLDEYYEKLTQLGYFDALAEINENARAKGLIK